MLFAIFFKRLNFFSRPLNIRNNGPVLLLRIILGIEAISCRLLLRMVRSRRGIKFGKLAHLF